MNSSSFFEIDRVSKNIEFEFFFRNYFELEKPVILEGAGEDWLARKKWNTQYLQEALSNEPSVEDQTLYFTMQENTLGFDYDIPTVVGKLLASPNTFSTHKNTIIWINTRKNTSHWHYHANFESVFNVQIKGKKKWYLASPDTPLPCYPYTHYVVFEDDQTLLKDKSYTCFTLDEGDLLYIPPLWFHKVTAQEQENINLVWVMTKKKTGITSKTLIRELERYSFDDYLSHHKFAAIRYINRKVTELYPNFMNHEWHYDYFIETNHKLSRFYVMNMILRELRVLGKTLITIPKILKEFKTAEKAPELNQSKT